MAFDNRRADPIVEGLNFRALRGTEDAEALHAVHVGRQVRDQLDPHSRMDDFPKLEEVRAETEEAATGGTLDQWCIAEVDGQVVGYGRVETWPERDGTHVYLVPGWVLPEWRGRGIGTALLQWGETRSRQLAAAEHPVEKLELAGNASSTELEAAALLLENGYHVAYTALEMRLDPAAPILHQPMPSGFTIRPALPEHWLPIVASIWDSYRNEYPGGRYDEGVNPEDYVDALHRSRHDTSLWQVAWAQVAGGPDEIAGQVMSALENGVAEVFEISVRPAWRRRGLARALLSAALQTLNARGANDIRLDTIAEFPTRAVDLYTSMGFRVIKEFPRYRKPLLLP